MWDIFSAALLSESCLGSIQEVVCGFGSIDGELAELLHKGGLLCQMADIFFGEQGLYFVYPRGRTVPALIYEPILSKARFEEEGEPKLHLYDCGVFAREYARVSTKTENAFAFSVRERGVDLKLFHQKPLFVCPKCLLEYNKKRKRALKPKEFSLTDYYSGSNIATERGFETWFRKLKGGVCQKCSCRKDDTIVLFRGSSVSLVCKQCLEEKR